jgi:1,4-dihydroxy-2-naphthoyl-CoA hydrolase
VWEVQIWRADPSTGECRDLVSTARVTMLIITNPSKPEEMSTHKASIKKYAKL